MIEDNKNYLETYFARKVIEGGQEVFLDFWSQLWTLETFNFTRPYAEVKVREAKEGDETPYWGWKNFEDKQYHFIAPHKGLVEMCFAYGSKAEEERGRGKLVKLIVEKVRDID